MRQVHGIVRHYDWGDFNAIPHLLGRQPDGRPHAELWFGTHPGAPATLDGGRTLESAVGPLPYLLKVLSAAKPLSLQVHPSSAQARRGFELEDAAGIPLNAANRTYRDPFHKPELLCALTPFEAVCGLAPPAESQALLADLGAPARELRRRLENGGIRAVVASLLEDRPSLAALLDASAHHHDPRCRWLSRLSQQYPGDPTAALVLLMNHVVLEPGEAIYLAAGNLHAYLCGTGVEVMSNSDNVVRAGLTGKHVDAGEVLRVLDTTPLLDPVVQPEAIADGVMRYPVPVPDFRVSRYRIEGAVTFTADGPELLFCTEGETIEISAGQCMLATHDEDVELVGMATVYRVGGAPFVAEVD